MNSEPIIPEGLTKKERKQFKKAFYNTQIQEQATKVKLRKYGIILGVLLFILGGGYLLSKESSKPKPGISVPSLGNKHIQNITDAHDPYNSLPPTSGTHVSNKAKWGINDEPIPDELQIHNLEDGGVVIQYNCTPQNDLQNSPTPGDNSTNNCDTLVNNLKGIVKKYSDKVLVAPYPKLDTRIALTAWTRIDKFNDYDEKRILDFIKAYKGIDHH